MRNKMLVLAQTQVGKAEKKMLVLFLAATLAVSGFFVANLAQAAHTAAVSVDKTLVKGGTTQAYSFAVTNNSKNPCNFLK